MARPMVHDHVVVTVEIYKGDLKSVRFVSDGWCSWYHMVGIRSGGVMDASARAESTRVGTTQITEVKVACVARELLWPASSGASETCFRGRSSLPRRVDGRPVREREGYSFYFW